ncbi:molecular chaperone [Kosakonia sp. H02]|nr:molecular chaperone [Kosakonia sp. H02]
MTFRFAALLMAVLFTTAFSTHAGLIAASTRVIFKEGQTQQSLMLVNTNSWPVMVQTWVDHGDIDVASPSRIKTPFVSIPTLFSLEPQQMQGLRLVYNQQALPEDRESVFWLNLYEIPPKSTTPEPHMQSVTLTMNTQMKIFWRPKNLGEPEDISKKISFSRVSNGEKIEIICRNASPWYVSFAGLSLMAGDKVYAVEQQPDMMVSPYGEKRYTVVVKTPPPAMLPLRIKAHLIDDIGQVYESEFPFR